MSSVDALFTGPARLWLEAWAKARERAIAEEIEFKALATWALSLVQGEATTRDPDLKGLYTRIFSDLPWPAPLPGPDEVHFRWNHRLKAVLGRCHPKEKIIEVNVILRDPRLSQELEYLMIHEAAHFIWCDHSPAFRAFLRHVGVREDYISKSLLYRQVQAEQAQRQLRLFEW